jgi:L-amino acid N-acyltransferase YncA
VKFAVEPLFPDLIEEIKPYVDDQYEELSNVKGQIPYELDLDQFKMLEDTGALKVVTARDGKLVGYVIWLLFPHLHFKGVLHAAADLYHVTKSERGKGTGRAMFEYSINFCKEIGVRRILMGEKMKYKHSKLLESFGFELTEQFYQLVIGQEND